LLSPLFKKGDKKDMTNYRPISLLTSFSKVFEKIMYEKLFQHIDINNSLVEEQFGFRSSASTSTASYRLRRYKMS
jgi:hypothetical protein